MSIRKLTDIDSIIIHCADTQNGALWHAEDINNWHRERGFKRDPLNIAAYRVSPHLPNIGYHYIIEPTGTLVRGRAFEEIGAHARGYYNRHGIGVCLVGQDAYTVEQWRTLRALALSLQARFGNKLRVMGHRDINPNKTCPGFHVTGWIEGGMAIPTEHLHQIAASDGSNG